MKDLYDKIDERADTIKWLKEHMKDLYDKIAERAEQEFKELEQEFKDDIINNSTRRRHSYYEVATKQEILEFLQTREQDDENAIKAFEFLATHAKDPLEYFYKTYCGGEDETWEKFRDILWSYRVRYYWEQDKEDK